MGVESESIDLVVTSPPYDNLRRYDNYQPYDQQKLIKEMFRTIKTGGVIVWICADQTINGSETLTSFRTAINFVENGFKLYDTMIWEKPSPQAPTEGRYYDVFEYMFVFSKGIPKTRNFLTDRKNISAGHISKRETRSCREDRKTSDRTRVVAEYSRRFNVWQIGRGQNKTPHPAVFPENLVRDHILTWSNENDLVCDPFLGSGTTAYVARALNRKYIGFEISEKYFQIAKNRLSQPNLFAL